MPRPYPNYCQNNLRLKICGNLNQKQHISPGQINFGPESGFQLTVSKNYFRPGDDVIFTCKKTASADNDNSPRNLVFPDSKGIEVFVFCEQCFVQTYSNNPPPWGK